MTAEEMAAAETEITAADDDQLTGSAEPGENEAEDDDSGPRRPLAPAAAAAEDEDDLDDLDDMEFMLDEIENRIAPLA